MNVNMKFDMNQGQRVSTEENFRELGSRIDSLSSALQDVHAFARARRNPTTLYVEISPYLDILENLRQQISNYRADIPNHIATKTISALANLNDDLTKVTKIFRGGGQVYSNIIQEFYDHFAELYESITPCITFLRVDVDPNVKKLEQLKTEQTVHAKSQLTSIQQVGNEAVNALRNEAAELVDKKFSSDFSRHATKLARTSWIWLSATALSAGIAVAMIFVSLGISHDADSTMMYVITVAGKFSLVAISSAIAVWCGRMYRSLQHQSFEYRHRALCLATYKPFIESLGDRSKESVLIAAANSIFSNVPTGLINQGKVDASHAFQFIQDVTKSQD